MSTQMLMCRGPSVVSK